jgi:hypothetical protein
MSKLREKFQDQPKQTIEELADKYDYTLGIEYCAFIEGYNHAQKEIDELRRDKDIILKDLIDLVFLIDNDESYIELRERIKVSQQLITKHK